MKILYPTRAYPHALGARGPETGGPVGSATRRAAEPGLRASRGRVSYSLYLPSDQERGKQNESDSSVAGKSPIYALRPYPGNIPVGICSPQANAYECLGHFDTEKCRCYTVALF